MSLEHVEVDGHRLEVEWFGEASAGPVLVFLHEGLGSAGLWRDFPSRAVTATGLRALAYTRAGYGGSSPVTLPRPLDYMQQEGLVALPLLLERMAVDEAILVGHSDGASIALIFAGSNDPRAARLRGLVLEAPHVFAEDVSIASIAAAREAFERGDLRKRLARWHGANVDVAFRGWNDAWLDPAFRQWNIERFVPSITVPMLLLQGADDEYGTLAQLEAIERGAVAPVEKLVLADCGHAPHRDQPEATLAALTRFVGLLHG